MCTRQYTYARIPSHVIINVQVKLMVDRRPKFLCSEMISTEGYRFATLPGGRTFNCCFFPQRARSRTSLSCLLLVAASGSICSTDPEADRETIRSIAYPSVLSAMVATVRMSQTPEQSVEEEGSGDYLAMEVKEGRSQKNDNGSSKERN